MQKALITIAVGLALNLPSVTLGQATESDVQPSVVPAFRVHIGGAVRNSGLFDLGPALTVSEALAMAGGPTKQGQEDRVWVFRNGEIITTLMGGRTLIADSPVRSGDQLFVAWQSTMPERSWLSQNAGTFTVLMAAAVGITIALLN